MTRPKRSGAFWQIALTVNVPAMERVTTPEVVGRGMNFWARGSGKWGVLELRTSQHLVVGEFVEQRSRDSGEVTKTGAEWGGHQWVCLENQLPFPALWRKNFYAKWLPGEESLRAKWPGSFAMGQVTWAMMPCALAGNQHFLRIAVVTGVHYRGSGDNGTAVSLTHLDWNWMEPRRQNTCQQAAFDHALWGIIQLGVMRGLERSIPQAGFARALWENGVAVQREGHLA